MASSRSFPNLNSFLNHHRVENGDDITHTRIGGKDKGLEVHGGKYHVDSIEQAAFWDLYHKQVFELKKPEFLTEKQLIEDGPILVDIDLRYESAVTEKQHTERHVRDLVFIYADSILQLVEMPPGTQLNIYVMEKPHVKNEPDRTKDGIHLLFGMKMHKGLQLLLRQKVINHLDSYDSWGDIPITNTWSDVFDERVTKGIAPWQVYGSKKPGYDAYALKYHYTMVYSGERECWDTLTERDVQFFNFNLKENLPLLSARYTGYDGFPTLGGVEALFKTACDSLNSLTAPPSRSIHGRPAPTVVTMRGQTGAAVSSSIGGGSGSGGLVAVNGLNFLDLSVMDTPSKLDSFITLLMSDRLIRRDYYKLKEVHDFTMTLPEPYYGENSYDKWLKVCFALSNTDPECCFPTFLKFSSQKAGFDWRVDPQSVKEQWLRSLKSNHTQRLTHRSILFWSKKEDPARYEEIKKSSIDYYLIESTRKNPTEFDIAVVLFNMYKTKYVCVTLKKERLWYHFDNHRWSLSDSANEMRLAISEDLCRRYTAKLTETVENFDLMQNGNGNNGSGAAPEEDDKKRKYIERLTDIVSYCKRTVWKNNIMREVAELFYDDKFMETLDQNPYLLCCNNGVVDFEHNTFRPGVPIDYISMSTGHDYIPFEQVLADTHGLAVANAEIEDFMHQLFPNNELYEYMWEHLAATLIGKNSNQTFNIYKGSGRNGKSKLVELMSKVLGVGSAGYKGSVPITLVTQKRPTIGGTSSEVAQLFGKRYAVMQEPNKGDKLNEGVLKELTGGDPLTARALFKDSITFNSQFKLVVCTNSDFEDTSNDDSFWRRIRMVDFEAKFLENPNTVANPHNNTQFPLADYPYQFQLDAKLEEKFERWAPVFLSKLVHKAFLTKGMVRDCAKVMESSNLYRLRQDHYARFAQEALHKVVPLTSTGQFTTDAQGVMHAVPPVGVTKQAYSAAFANWKKDNLDRNSGCRLNDLHEYIVNTFGPYNSKTGYLNMEIDEKYQK